MKTIAAITAFIFALPIVLSCFIYLGAAGGAMYFIIYFIFCLCFVPVSVLLLLISFFIKGIREISVAGIIISAILTGMFAISVTISALHNESEFITGANYSKFNSEKWKKADYNGTNQREYMLKDLVQNIMPDKNMKEIINLLGAPYAIISEGKTYYSYSEDGSTVFRASSRDESGNIKSYEFLDINALYRSETKEENMIYYITGPAFMDHATLNIYFDKNGIFREYKLSSS
jgi:hypothetical protein